MYGNIATGKSWSPLKLNPFTEYFKKLCIRKTQDIDPMLI